METSGKYWAVSPNVSLRCPNRERWLETLGIRAIWEDGSVFLDNANGQFTRDERISTAKFASVYRWREVAIAAST
jgi:hypothetical protein